ncbi:MAG: lysylphosphatidylglycerol synthase transmembrane domain-containing protein [bacterium]|nr:lysylphosphatidylglycerol synthase transmembrane domain-containing protein [bacterium]
MKKEFLLLIKAAVSGSLLYLVFRRTDLMSILDGVVQLPLWSFLAALILSLTAVMFASFRWGLFIKSHLGRGRVFSFYLAGMFFNTVLPGLVGGDAVKGYYLYKEGSTIPNTVSSLFMDRFLGYVVLLGMGTAAYPFALPVLKGTELVWAFPVILATFITISYLILYRRAGSRFGFIASFLESLDACFVDTGAIGRGLLFSLIVQALNVLTVYILAVGFGLDITILVLMAFLPIIVTLASVPITVSGLGVREASFVVFFGAYGLNGESALALSLAWFGILIATGLVGLIEYLRSGRGVPPTPKEPRINPDLLPSSSP